MHRYIARRLLYSIPVILFVVVFVFLVLRVLPGEPIDAIMGEAVSVTPQQLDLLREQLGLDRPLHEQFGVWLWGLVRFDLGNSLVSSSVPVTQRILDAVPVSAQLGAMAVTIGVLIGIPVGLIAALRQDTPADYAARVFGVFGLSVPDFFLATLLVMLPAIWFGWRGPLEYVSPLENPWQNFQQFILPASVLGYSMAGPVSRLTRSSMLEVIRSDYIRTAYAKGLRERTVVLRHALKNALIPVVTIIGARMGFLLGGSLIVETVFGLPGMGRLTGESILSFDYPQVQANVMLLASVVIMANLVVDITYGWLDPRIVYE